MDSLLVLSVHPSCIHRVTCRLWPGTGADRNLPEACQVGPVPAVCQLSLCQVLVTENISQSIQPALALNRTTGVPDLARVGPSHPSGEVEAPVHAPCFFSSSGDPRCTLLTQLTDEESEAQGWRGLSEATLRRWWQRALSPGQSGSWPHATILVAPCGALATDLQSILPWLLAEPLEGRGE